MNTLHTSSVLLTPELIARFAEVGGQPSENPLVICKFIDPSGLATFYATEFHVGWNLFYGYTHLLDGEWGCFSLDKLSKAINRSGLGIERDIYFQECRFFELKL